MLNQLERYSTLLKSYTRPLTELLEYTHPVLQQVPVQANSVVAGRRFPSELNALHRINGTNYLYYILICQLSVLIIQAQRVGLAKPRVNPVHFVDELGVGVRQFHHRNNRRQVVF